MNPAQEVNRLPPHSMEERRRAIGLAMAESGLDLVVAAPGDDGARLAAAFATSEAVDDLEGAPPDWPVRLVGRVGHVGFDASPHRLAEALLARLGGGVSVDRAFSSVSARKTTEELVAALEATRIAEDAWTRLLRSARPGMRECNLAIDLILYMEEQGADDVFLMLNAAMIQLAFLADPSARACAFVACDGAAVRPAFLSSSLARSLAA